MRAVRPTLLLVEADSHQAGMIRRDLRKQGFGVEVSGSAEAGLRLAHSKDYDAILLAIKLPGKSGIAMLRELRRRGSAVPVMIVSERSSVRDRVQGLDLGADDYLPKPFDLQELVARLRAIMRRPEAPPRIVLTAADLTLDTVRCEVWTLRTDIPASPATSGKLCPARRRTWISWRFSMSIILPLAALGSESGP